MKDFLILHSYYPYCVTLLFSIFLLYKLTLPLFVRICPQTIKITTITYFFLSYVSFLILFLAKKFSWFSNDGNALNEYGKKTIQFFVFFTQIDFELQIYFVLLSIIFIPFFASYLFCGYFGIGRFPVKLGIIFRGATIFCAKGFISFSAVSISSIIGIPALGLSQKYNPTKFLYCDEASIICFFAFLTICVFSNWEACLNEAHLKNNRFFNLLECINKRMTKNEIDSVKR